MLQDMSSWEIWRNFEEGFQSRGSRISRALKFFTLFLFRIDSELVLHAPVWNVRWLSSTYYDYNDNIDDFHEHIYVNFFLRMTFMIINNCLGHDNIFIHSVRYVQWRFQHWMWIFEILEYIYLGMKSVDRWSCLNRGRWWGKVSGYK